MARPAESQEDRKPPDLSTIGGRLLASRKRLGLSQQEVAVRLTVEPDSKGEPRNISRAAYTQWELGLTTPDVDRVRMAANVLNVSAAYLAFGEPDGSGSSDSRDVVWLQELEADVHDGPAASWPLLRTELTRLGKAARDIRVIRVPHGLAGSELTAGSPALVDCSVQVVEQPGIYVFANGDRLDVAAMAPRGSEVVVRSGAVTFAAAAADVDVRGRIVSGWIDL